MAAELNMSQLNTHKDGAPSRTKIDSFSDERRAELDKDIRDGKSGNFIRRKYNITWGALQNYKNRLTKEEIRPMATAPLNDRIAALETEIVNILEACKKVLMVDGKYNFSPRADEIDVIWNDGKANHRSTMAELLSRIESENPDVDLVLRWQYMREDPRNVLLKTAKLMQEQLELCARVAGIIQDVQINVDVQGVVLPKIVTIINEAAKDAPQIREEIIKRLAQEAGT